jgi:AraC-like DNA-binding protein/ligand-binding sensor protein
MSKTPNIIQRRELDPVMLKAHKVVEHYQKALDCTTMVIGPDCDTGSVHFCSVCDPCHRNGTVNGKEKICPLIHINAINEARRLGGSYVYVCPAGFIFWTSPFYSGERFAGALLSGGVMGAEKKGGEVKAFAQMMMICADQISGMGIGGFDTAKPGTGTPEGENKTEDAKNDSYPIDMERMLLASLRRGDNGEAQKILKNLLDTLYKSTKGNLPVFRLKAIELVVLLSRSVCDPRDIEDEAVFETNNRYLKKIEECSSLQEINKILSVITERMSGKIFSFHGIRHSSALRKAERYIWENYTRKISLQEIADASGLSAPYLSTIFKNEMGENLSNYLNRLRVEKAAAMLVTTNLPISGITAACGFEDQSWFSKKFKKITGYSPGKYREQGSVL